MESRWRTASPRPWRRRAGFTVLEAQVSFVLLGIGLAGVCPLIVMQVKLSKRVEAGFGQNGWFRPDDGKDLPERTYLVPASDRWTRKLGAAARPSASNTAVAPPGQGPYRLTLIDPVVRPFGAEALVLRVRRTPPPEEDASGGGGPPP